MKTAIFTIQIALAVALAAFFVERFFYAEGTRRPLSSGPFSPISRPGRLVFCLAGLVLFLHTVHLLQSMEVA